MIASRDANPVAALFQELGLSADAVAAHYDLPVDTVTAVLGPVPSAEVAAVLTMLPQKYCFLTLRKSPPWRMVIERAGIEPLWKDREWRRSVGLCWFPRNNLNMRELLALLRAQGNSNPMIATILQGSFIPPPDGAGDWTLSKVAHLFEVVRKPKTIRDIPLEQYHRREEFVRHVIAELTARIVPNSVKVALEWPVEVTYGPVEVVLAPVAQRMPLLLTDFLRQSVQRLGWFVEKKTRRPLWRWEWPEGAPPTL